MNATGYFVSEDEPRLDGTLRLTSVSRLRKLTFREVSYVMNIIFRDLCGAKRGVFKIVSCHLSFGKVESYNMRLSTFPMVLNYLSEL